MSGFRNRLATCVGAFSVAIASWSCCTAEKKAAITFVAVPSPGLAAPQSTPDKPTIHISKKEQLLWKGPPGAQLTTVTIHLKRQPAPFAKCGAGDPCVIRCDADGVCVSGPIHEGLTPPAKGFYYDYDTAFGPAAKGDPGFIIRP